MEKNDLKRGGGNDVNSQYISLFDGKLHSMIIKHYHFLLFLLAILLVSLEEFDLDTTFVKKVLSISIQRAAT